MSKYLIVLEGFAYVPDINCSLIDLYLLSLKVVLTSSSLPRKHKRRKEVSKKRQMEKHLLRVIDSFRLLGVRLLHYANRSCVSQLIWFNCGIDRNQWTLFSLFSSFANMSQFHALIDLQKKKNIKQPFVLC